MAIQVKTIINADWIIPVVPKNTILENHSLIVNNDYILDILPQNKVSEKYVSDEIHNLKGHAITPGFVNAHTHLAMSLMKGFADDLPLHEWLNDYIWPAESEILSEEMVYDGTKLALAELIRGGVTCVNDHYFFPDKIVKCMNEIGIRGVVANCIFNFPLPWAQNHINISVENIKNLSGHPLIKAALGPHSPYVTDDMIMKKVCELSNQYKIPVHIHLHETTEEITTYKKKKGQSPIEYFDKQGWLNEYSIAVHVVHLTDHEAHILAKNKVSVVHCPESNMKLSSGKFPWDLLKKYEVNIALGTDGSTSNNDLDMFGEIKTASFLAKLQFGPKSMKSTEALEMLTINGAKALHLDHLIGSLEIGKKADFISIDLHTPETLPIYNPISQLIYACSRSQVKNVWCNGNQLMAKRALTTIDLENIYIQQNIWKSKLINLKISSEKL